VSLTAKAPLDVLRTCQNHWNRVLNKVLTRYRLQFTGIDAKQERAALSFLEHREPIAVPLSPSPWYLYLGQHLRAIPEGRLYALRIVKYEYRIQRAPSLQEEATVRFEYASRDIEPMARYSRHHVQFHRDSQSGSPDFSLSKLHIPTGGVIIEDVIRFLIADLGVPPLTEQWEEELRSSVDLTREWIDYAEK
jgi:hypothetical protein